MRIQGNPGEAARNHQPEAPPRPIIELRGISKYFGKLRANHDISLTITPGRIKALLGENGAGKSTLMSILSGRLQPDAGSIRVDGRTVSLDSPRAAHAAGIGMVYQHFMLVDCMTVAENVVLGNEGSFLLRISAVRDKVRRVSERYGLQVDPAARVRSLSMGERQRVEILKLLSRESRVLIFDEPTAVLTPTEVAQLFAAMRRMTAQGKAIVFISHKLPEVLEIADEVAILRRGEVVDEFERRDVPDEAELARRMLGREIRRGVRGGASVRPGEAASPDSPYQPCSADEENQLRLAMGKLPLHLGPGAAERRTGPAESEKVLELCGVDYRQLRGVSLSVLRGEILAIVGVAGNGQKELVELICGGLEPECGTVGILGRPGAKFRKSAGARGGLSYIPEDRKGVGACAPLNLLDNFLLTTYRLYSGPLLLDRGRARQAVERIIADYNLSPPDWRVRAGELSGGNLQKLIVGRELMRDPACIVAENPTQGLDIAATEEVWKRLKIARESCGVLLVTGDLDEALALADRVGVMYRGRIVDIFSAGDREKLADIGLLMAGAGHGA